MKVEIFVAYRCRIS